MMVTDKDTDKVYFSAHIRRYKCWKNISEVLLGCNIDHAFLENTADIWVRDFMPVQTDVHTFAAYRYMPDYLQGNERFVTKDVRRCYDFEASSLSDIDAVLDGGNIIRCGSKTVMTDKIFKENNGLSAGVLVDMIEKALDTEVVIIPWDNDNEPYGHADGMVRYVGDGKILINHYKDYDTAFRHRLTGALRPHFNEIYELSYGKNARAGSWAHLNFLRVGNTILVPTVNIPSDDMAVGQISNVYAGCRVIPVEMKGVVRNGGALNCISWNIKTAEH